MIKGNLVLFPFLAFPILLFAKTNRRFFISFHCVFHFSNFKGRKNTPKKIVLEVWTAGRWKNEIANKGNHLARHYATRIRIVSHTY
jgi:hypothetical protein